jgi:hypothetical protein
MIIKYISVCEHLFSVNHSNNVDRVVYYHVKIEIIF